MKRILLFFFVLGGVFCHSIQAEQVTLKNGDRLTGVILKADGKTLTLKSEFVGMVEVQWDAIDQIASDEPLYLTLKDTQMIVGTVKTSDGQFEVRTIDAGTVIVAKESIESVRSKDEQAAYEAELDRLRNPGLGDLWRGAADVGLSLAQGNAETTTFNLGVNADRTTPRDKISVYATSLYATNSTTGESVKTANAIRGGGRYEVNLTPRVFTYGFGDLEFDEFQKLDLRMVLGGGAGWHVVKSERTLFDLFGGGAFNKEVFSDGTRRTSGEASVGEELTHSLSDRVLFKERLVVFPNLSNTGKYRMNFDTSVVTSLNRWLGWHVTLSDRFLSNPPLGTKKNDLLLSTGLRVTFGRRD